MSYPPQGKTAQVVETISYAPGVKDTTDLVEPGTITIVAVAEGAVANCSAALTLTIPTDTRLAIVQIASRLAVTIDSMTAGTLFCRVYVDVQDAAHRLFDLSWAVAGAKLSVVNLTAGTIFNLLKNGAAHTFYFFFWVDAGNAVISLVELWEGVGDGGTAWWTTIALSLTFKGIIGVHATAARVGTGGTSMMICAFNSGAQYPLIAPEAFSALAPSANVSGPIIRIFGTVATDLVYLSRIDLTLFRIS